MIYTTNNSLHQSFCRVTVTVNSNQFPITAGCKSLTSLTILGIRVFGNLLELIDEVTETDLATYELQTFNFFHNQFSLLSTLFCEGGNRDKNCQ